MSRVRTLSPSNNLNNIPHMLRNLAGEYERGDQPMPRTVFVVGINDGDVPPDLFQFGQELSRLEEAGALTSCVHRILKVEGDES